MNSKPVEMATHQPAAAYDTPPAYPQPQGQQPVHLHPPPPQQMTAAQVGEQYRAELFAQCAQGVHDPKTKYGVCGIITAVLCFPCGLICLFLDTEKRCARCGVKVKKPKKEKKPKEPKEPKSDAAQ
uniref:Uncharacterized protein n=1 Tax=Schizophyllum commune (strain H4-8 / FGSC 9210) TaxID=578458 RepID=D8PT71_SCHCM